MELAILLVVLAVAVLGVVLGFVATRLRGRGVELEPPPVEEVEAPPRPAGGVAVEVPPAPVEEAEAPAAPALVRPSFRDRLAKARGALSGYLNAIRSRKIDSETWDELEEALIRADVGVATTERILGKLRAQAEAAGTSDPEELLDQLKVQLKDDLATGDRALRLTAAPGATGAASTDGLTDGAATTGNGAGGDGEGVRTGPSVWLVVGVNGTGKTTTIGKIAHQQQALGRSVVMAAGDTFRAAAAEQLATWAERTGSDIVRGSEGGDPSSVVFDAVQRAAARGHDLVLADTAGRLHTKTNLMEELRKVRRVADRDPGSVTEVLLVLDATTGQNGLNQARQFAEAVDLTGVVLTKLDGSAKGGIALAIQTTLGIPIKLVGLGEGLDDLVEFDPDEFVEALFA